MSDGNDHAIGLKDRLLEEFTRYLTISACLYTRFGAIQFDRAAQLAEQGERYVPPGFARKMALIPGRFVLIGEPARVGTRAHAPTRPHRIEVDAASLLVLPLLVPLIVAEELDNALQPGGRLARRGTNDTGARPGAR